MTEAKFVLSKKKVIENYNQLRNLGLKVSYSYKTNKEVGNVLQDYTDAGFSIHEFNEIEMIKDKLKIIFFAQAWNKDQIKKILKKGVKSFVVDNEIDLNNLLNVIETMKIKVNLSFRMKFQEHRISSGKYFVYGMPATKVNEIIDQIKDNSYIDNLGIHIHRKSQNVTEWEIKQELEDSLNKTTLERLNSVNLGGGLPSTYKSYTSKVMPYIFNKIIEAKDWLKQYNIETIVEPGRFIAAPAIKLITTIIQVQGRNIIINTTLYNCALDTLIGHHKMLIENELSDQDNGNYYLIKGNSPTRDDIFRYRVKLDNPKIGDKLVFLNAGAYNYTTDFFGYKKLKTEIIE